MSADFESPNPGFPPNFKVMSPFWSSATVPNSHCRLECEDSRGDTEMRRHERILSAFLLMVAVAVASLPPILQQSYGGFSVDPPVTNDTNRPDGMIARCYKTICRDWMHECHWFCDQGKSSRCVECLSWRGQHCYDCFKFL